MSLGIYIHIPFCQSACNYCHFVRMGFDREIAERYHLALKNEIKLFCSSRKCEQVDSIYFGGGTPSLVPAEHIVGILDECGRHFSIVKDSEISLEANPETVNAAKLKKIRRAGANRISLGAQSFSERELAAIGRVHSAARILEALKILRAAAFQNINMDLMLGLPHQTEESWRQSLQEPVRLSVPHISVYMLDLDQECALSQLVSAGSVKLPEEDQVSDWYLYTIEFLSSCGYRQYEISNFAKPGFECRHNLKYWRREAVQGFGLGSHSFVGNSRYVNNAGIDGYLRSVEAGESPVIWQQPVTGEKALQEALFLGLRLKNGVDWSELSNTYHRNNTAQYEDFFKELLDEGFMEQEGSIFRLTPAGMLISNEIFLKFV